MNTTEGTTCTPKTATPDRQHGKVDHLFWVDNMEIAIDMGVEARSLCGFWTRPPRSKDGRHGYVVIVGGLMPLPEPHDCKRCLRVLEAHERRAWLEANR